MTHKKRVAKRTRSSEFTLSKVHKLFCGHTPDMRLNLSPESTPPPSPSQDIHTPPPIILLPQNHESVVPPSFAELRRRLAALESSNPINPPDGESPSEEFDILADLEELRSLLVIEGLMNSG